MRRTCLALLLTGAHLLAQTGETRVRVKFRALSFEGPILGAAYLDGNDVRPLDLSADCFTAEQTYVGPNPLRLVLRDDAVPAAAPPVVRPGAARMAALAQELETVQRRLATLTADARERGGQAQAGAASEIAQLKSRSQTLNAELTQLAQASTQAAETPPTAPAPKSETTPKTRPAAGGVATAPTAQPKPARPTHRPLAAFTFPSDGRLLMLVHRTDQGTTVNAIDDREGAFPFGTMQFINLTGGPVEIRFGAKILALAPKGKGTLRPGGGNNTYAEGEIHTRAEDGQMRLGYSMRIFQQDDVRTLYFLLPVEDGGHGVRLKGIEERRADEPVPPVVGGAGEKPAAPAR
jgi:hypothetical protein